MGSRRAKKLAEEPPGGLGHDPLSGDALLARTFYQDERPLVVPVPAPPPDAKPPKPTHYKVVSISLYQEDIERLEAMVAELKRRGHTKANKSQLIRFALDTVDLDALPKSY